VQGIQVASREDVRVYRDRGVPLRTLGRELGVDFVLLGSVRRAGNRARISAQLARACDGATLWAERFDRTLDDLFAMQAEVSRLIVGALRVALEPGEREMLDRAPTRSTAAYTLYLRARELLDSREHEDNLQAEGLLQEALQLDADFALAHAALAECFAERGHSWWTDLEEAAELAMPHALRALELAPDLIEAHLARATLYRLRGEGEELLRAAERIVAMDPECQRAQVWAGWSYMVLGKPELALGIWERLMRRPGRPYFLAATLATCYEMLGRPEDEARTRGQALEDQLDFVQKHPGHAQARVWLGIELIKNGRVDDGLSQVDKAVLQAPNDGRLRYNAACAFAKAGQTDRAIAELKHGVRNLRTYASDWAQRDPDLESLAGHPEFVRLFSRPR
jgi:adenylate cyclase